MSSRLTKVLLVVMLGILVVGIVVLSRQFMQMKPLGKRPEKNPDTNQEKVVYKDNQVVSWDFQAGKLTIWLNNKAQEFQINPKQPVIVLDQFPEDEKVQTLLVYKRSQPDWATAFCPGDLVKLNYRGE